MSTTGTFRLFFLTGFIILFCATLTAQVKIKERVEISPANTVNPPIIRYSELSGITLPPIDPEVTALSSSGGFLGGGYDCEDPDADLPFTSRIGGNLRIALFQCGGCVDADIYNETLLIFGPDGNIRHIFPMALFDSCLVPGADGKIHVVQGCWGDYYDQPVPDKGCYDTFNPFIFHQSAYEQALERDGSAKAADFMFPPDRLNVPIKPWEPLRFRLYSEKNGMLYKCVNCFYRAVVMGPDSIVYAGNWTQLPEVLVFRSGDYDVYSHYDPATVFPLNFVRDSSVTGPAPSSIETPYPAFVTDSGMYRIIMAAAKPNTHGALTMTSPVSQVIFPDIQSAMGDTVLVGPYSEGTKIQLELSGCRTYIREMNYGQWRFQYENWTDYDFGDAIVDVQYAVGRPDHLELWSNTETIYYGDTIDVDVVPCDKDGLFSPLGPDCYYEFSVELTGETSNYVELIYDDVGSNIVEHVSSENRRGLGVRLAANKLEPDSVVDLTFNLTASEFGEIGAASVIPTTTQPTRMAKLSKNIHIKMKSGDNSAKNIVDQQISESIASKVKLGQKKESGINSKPVVYHKRKIGHLISRQGSSSANQTSKLIQVKDASTNEIRYSIANGAAWNVIMQNDNTIGEKKHTILLGETIYYQAKPDLNDKTGTKLIFKEMSETTGWETGYPAADFTVTAEKPTDKLGVYYEYRDNDGIKLENNLIRLVGRYWTDTQTYEVRLKATSGERSGSILVVVKKPSKLGDTFNKANNFKGVSYDLDALIFEYAGREGIMPQYLKGVIGEETMGLFDPCYRYEPFQDLKKLQKKDPKTGVRLYELNDYSHYRILSANDKGTPSIPTDHSNIRDASCVGNNKGNRIQYPGYQNLWDFYWDHDFYSLNYYNGPNTFEKYWENEYKKAQTELYPDKAEGELSSTEKQIISDSSNARFFHWIRYDYNGGAENMVAQTRISASYGILQLVYLNGKEYPQNNGSYRPEDISDYIIGFKYGIQHLIGKFNLKNVLNKKFSDSTWKAGLEAKYKQAIGAYNGAGDTYANRVFSRVPSFLPQP